jgi:predicted nucleic acid-binding protein
VAELLVDTDVFIDHLRGARELRAGRNLLSYSVITRCELFAGASADEQVIGRLLSPFRELPVDRAIAEGAGRIRRKTRVRTPDALIAATALRFGLVLLTSNASDFARIRELRSRTPR